MAQIDWNKLYRATNTENKPTPGYLFHDIVQDVSNASPKDIPAVAAYLAECVDGDHAHVKLKALFVIKTLAYRIPPFCACMQEHLASIHEAMSFEGPPSALYGDEPYKLVREAAEAAMLALTGGEFYHEQHREMSQRIVGFGNYQPGEDTVLPDGSVNVARDITVSDLAVTTVSLLTVGVSAIFGGVKDLLVSGPYKQGTGLQHDCDDLGDDCDDGGAGMDPDDRRSFEIAGSYEPSSSGSLYVPPVLPPVPENPAADYPEDSSVLDLTSMMALGLASQAQQLEVTASTQTAAESSEEHREELFRLLGIKASPANVAPDREDASSLI